MSSSVRALCRLSVVAVRQLNSPSLFLWATRFPSGLDSVCVVVVVVAFSQRGSALGSHCRRTLCPFATGCRLCSIANYLLAPRHMHTHTHSQSPLALARTSLAKTGFGSAGGEHGWERLSLQRRPLLSLPFPFLPPLHPFTSTQARCSLVVVIFGAILVPPPPPPTSPSRQHHRRRQLGRCPYCCSCSDAAVAAAVALSIGPDVIRREKER